MERFGHFKSYIEGPKISDISSFLYDVSLNSGCELTILDRDKGLWFEKIYFKFSGYESNLLKVKKLIEDSIEEFNEPIFESKKYKVKNTSIIIDHFNNVVELNLDTNKFSNIKSLIEKAVNHTDAQLLNNNEKNNGFLKGKNIDAKIYFKSNKKMEKFLTIFENHIISQNNVQKLDKLSSFKFR